jgi:hypothetical protein
MDNPRDLPINRVTGNFVDEVAAAYQRYLRMSDHDGKLPQDLTFQEFHDSRLCPAHDACTSCYNEAVGK